MKIIEGFNKAKKLLNRQAPKDLEYKQEAAVRQIINDVRQRGDKALLELTEKFDGAKLTTLEVKPAQIKAAYKKVDVKPDRCHETGSGAYREFSSDAKGTHSTNIYSRQNRLAGQTVRAGRCLCTGRYRQLSIDGIDDCYPG